MHNAFVLDKEIVRFSDVESSSRSCSLLASVMWCYCATGRVQQLNPCCQASFPQDFHIETSNRPLLFSKSPIPTVDRHPA